MARYGPEHKEQTRRRILEAAGPRLKQDGIDGSGVSTLMADAGLTNGAFYAHFDSKTDLVAHAIADQLRSQRAMLQANVADLQQLDDFVRSYLSLDHRCDRSGGCPSAALLDEVGRSDEEVRAAYTEELLQIVDDLATHLAPDDPSSARVRVLTTFAAMVGTIQMARALTDESLAEELLAHALDQLLFSGVP